MHVKSLRNEDIIINYMKYTPLQAFNFGIYMLDQRE